MNTPRATIEMRRHAVAIQDAKQLADFTENELAEFLEHFNGYPYDDPGLAECERETFISYDVEGFGDQKLINLDSFIIACDTEDLAYQAFCEFYTDILRQLGIITHDTCIVTIPSRKTVIYDHQQLSLHHVEVEWVCPVCHQPRGTVGEGRVYDGSLYFGCSTWKNPCGHIDMYKDVLEEAKKNGLNSDV